MNLKISIMMAVVLSSLIALQTWRVSGLQEEVGSLSLANEVFAAQEEERIKTDTLVNDVRSAIADERKRQRSQRNADNKRILEALANVETNACFRDTTAIPSQYIGVLNNESNHSTTAVPDG